MAADDDHAAAPRPYDGALYASYVWSLAHAVFVVGAVFATDEAVWTNSPAMTSALAAVSFTFFAADLDFMPRQYFRDHPSMLAHHILACIITAAVGLQIVPRAAAAAYPKGMAAMEISTVVHSLHAVLKPYNLPELGMAALRALFVAVFIVFRLVYVPTVVIARLTDVVHPALLCLLWAVVALQAFWAAKLVGSFVRRAWSWPLAVTDLLALAVVAAFSSPDFKAWRAPAFLVCCAWLFWSHEQTVWTLLMFARTYVVASVVMFFFAYGNE